MRIELFPATTKGYYRLESFNYKEAENFAKQTCCPACGTANDFKVIAMMGGRTSSDALKLVCCRSCGQITYDRLPLDPWLDHFYGKVFDQVSQQWTFQASEGDFKAPWGSFDHIRDLGLPLESRILDFGCGYGTGLTNLRRLGYENFYGVEVGERRAGAAKKQFPGRVICGSVTEAKQLVEQDGPFDLIVLHHVVEHLRDPFEILSKLVSLLDDKGILAVAVPEIYAESPIHLPLYFPHLHHFNTTSMMRLMKRLGLSAFRWTQSQPQLAVVGSRDPDWKPDPSRFSNTEPSIDDAFTGEVSRFVEAPWRQLSSAGVNHLSYFHPWMAPGYPSGFQATDRRILSWTNVGRSALIPLNILNQKLGDKRDRFAIRATLKIARMSCGLMYRSFFKVTRALIKRETLINSEVIGFVPVDSADGNIPWLTMSDDAIPVLVK